MKEIFQQFGLQVAHVSHSQRSIQHQVGPAAQVNRGDGQRFIHRHHEVPGAIDTLFGTQRLAQKLAQDEAHVFHGVVLIDIQITTRLQIQVEAAVPGEKLQHMVEEANAGRDFVSAMAVQIQAPADIGLGGFSMQGCGARFHVNHPVEE